MKFAILYCLFPMSVYKSPKDVKDEMAYQHDPSMNSASSSMNPGPPAQHHSGNHGVLRDEHGGMMMSMVFHGGYKEVILFDFWRISSVGGLIGSCTIIFIVAVLYEGFKLCLRDMVQKLTDMAPQSESSNQLMHNCEEQENPVVGEPAGPSSMDHPTNGADETITRRPTVKGRISFSGHVVQTLLHLIQVVASYLLMLVFMTYNVWLCAAVALGAAAGYAIFGRYKPWSDNGLSALSEHCN